MLFEPDPRPYTPYVFIDQEDEVAVKDELPEFLQTAVQSPRVESGFWRRQFGNRPTPKQRTFDWIFGVIMPVICFAFDPIVFKSSMGPGDALFSNYRPFGYVLSYASIMATMAFLLWGQRLGAFNVITSGILAAGSFGALLIALLIFPYSLIGLLIAIGALGFTPFLTFIVFLRNSIRAFDTARPYLDARTLKYTFGLSALAGIVIPMVVNGEMGKNIVERLFNLIT
jgi:hypothetical protein